MSLQIPLGSTVDHLQVTFRGELGTPHEKDLKGGQFG